MTPPQGATAVWAFPGHQVNMSLTLVGRDRGDPPFIQSKTFLGLGYEVLRSPWGQTESFFEVLLYIEPHFVQRTALSIKDTPITFFPKFPDKKPREELPHAV